MTEQARLARLPPFSLRLTPEERAQLIVAADGEPLGSYIKACALKAPRRRGASPADRQALTKVLAVLGQSRIAANLNQLAKAANLGVFVLDEEDSRLLREAVSDLGLIRSLLVEAIGLKEPCL